MPISVILLFLLSCSFVADEAEAIQIGVLVNTNSREGREQKIGIDVAVQNFNSSSTTLFVKVNDCNSTNIFQLISNAEDLIAWGAKVIIIGTGSWPEIATIEDVTSRAEVLLLSLATSAPVKSVPRPLFSRMSTSESSQVHCIADIIQLYNWRRVIVIYEDDEYGSMSGIVVLLLNALRDIGAEIDYEAAFPPLYKLPNPKASVQRELEVIRKQLSQVYIVLRSSPSLAGHLFEGAKELGMMTKGHVWITNEDLTDLLDSTFSTFFKENYMQGIIGIKTYFTETTTSYHEFSKEFMQRFRREYSEKGDYHFEPGIFSLRAYDAVHAIACGAARTDEQHIKLFQETSFEFLGLSGEIRVKRDGTVAEGRDSAFRIINMVGRSYKDLGFWKEKLGFCKEEDKMGYCGQEAEPLRPVNFPGNPNRAPGGWGPLRILVPAHTSFDQFVNVEYDEESKVRAVKGFCIDVFKETLKRLKYDLEYHEFIPFYGTYDELVAQVALKVFDAVVGDTVILSYRLANVTFTEPYLGSGLSMLVPLKPNHQGMVLAKPFTLGVWVLILVSLVYTGTIVWYLERRSNPDFNGSWGTQLEATLWLIFSSIFYAHGRVYNSYSRAVIIVWLFMVMILTTSYTANLSSILTTQKLEPEVHHAKVGCDGDSFIVKYLQDVLGYNEQSIVKIGTADNYARAFESGEITAAYLETPYLRIFLSRHDGYTVHGETHRLGGLGFVFQKGSPIADDISEAILKLVEDGTIKQLEKKWFSFFLSNCPGPDNTRSEDSVSLDHLLVVFLISGGASTLVFLIFLARLLWTTRYATQELLENEINLIRVD